MKKKKEERGKKKEGDRLSLPIRHSKFGVGQLN